MAICVGVKGSNWKCIFGWRSGTGINIRKSKSIFVIQVDLGCNCSLKVSFKGIELQKHLLDKQE